jgi:HipA-like kinase
VTRYVTPLREGGSLPGLMEADDLGTYVVKFRGAGQGPKALIAEVISGLLARACGLRVPDLVAVELDPALAPGEPDQEIQDLLRASGGLNLGVDFLPGALDFDVKSARVDPDTAGRILWLDGLTVNADRSWRNPNMLLWHGQLYLIDHGATLTFQHRWSSAAAAAQRPYDAAQHALIGCGGRIETADSELAPLVTAGLLGEIVAQVPAEWLAADTEFGTEADARRAYCDWLLARLAARSAWVPGLAALAADRSRR